MTSTAPSLLPPHRRPYWHAKGLAEIATARFQKARAARDEEALQRSFFLVTHYYARTLLLLREALEDRNEALATVVLKNMLVLDGVVGAMHRAEPDVIPLALPLTEHFYNSYMRGLIVRVFEEDTGVLSRAQLMERLEEFDLLGELSAEEVAGFTTRLVGEGILEAKPRGHRRTAKHYVDLSIDAAILATLLGDDLAGTLAKHGFEGLSDIRDRRLGFIMAFMAATGMSNTVGALLVDVALAFQDEQRAVRTPWRFRDLIHSHIPRPYQLEAYAVFRGYGYRGVVVEAPTGSGKTLIGMMCIQDWLEAMVPGQSILVLVPTNNYQQQWVRELCYNPLGLQLAPEVVFAGTPSELIRYKARMGETPAVMVLTYTALAQRSTEDGVFDRAVARAFLHDHTVEHVILDEVHKVAADLKSASAQVVAEFTRVLEAGHLPHVIGFTGTATAYAERFERLGLRLVHSVSMIELVASGFVAPFAEFGVPFAYSARERSIRALLDRYKDLVRAFFNLAGPARLRSAFAEVPMPERVRIARQLLGMYEGRKDAEAAAEARLVLWETGEEIGLPEAPLVTLLQVATGRSDLELVPASAKARAEELFAEAEEIRAALKELIFLPEALVLLDAPGLGRTLDAPALRALLEAPMPNTQRRSRARTLLSSTLAGLYAGISSWYRHMGEGRVDAIRAVIQAEQQTRPLSGVIIFDHGRRIRWERGLATPGYDGVAGLFAEMLGDSAYLPVAALSSELYVPRDGVDDLPARIADYIERVLMQGEIGGAMHDLLTIGLDWKEQAATAFRAAFEEHLAVFTQGLAGQERPRLKPFVQTVLRPLRRAFGHRQRGISRQAAARLRRRLHPGNSNLRSLLTSFFDYAALARRWREPEEAELAQASGRRQRFYVVRMPGGRRKQLMYELVGRLVDEESLPINMIIVSTWARTGWNVISPNVLIDATATRDVTAWQQLRGRAMRARRSWTNDCYRLEALLLGTRMMGLDASDTHLPADVHAIFKELAAAVEEPIEQDASLRALLESILTPAERKRYRSGALDQFTPAERQALAVRLMQVHNKVTHVHELVKAIGSPSQIMRDRDEGRWVRREALAQKHAHEVAVDLEAGVLAYGEAHAPLLYADDPRLDAPTALEEAIQSGITDQDPTIIRAWLQGVTTPPIRGPIQE